MKRATIMLLTALGLGILFVFVILLIQIAQPPEPPLVYDQAVYAPEVAALCPGDNLVYTNTLTINRPGVIYGAPSWFSGHGTTALPILGFKFSDLVGRTFDQVPVIVTRRRSNVVPTMPPGPAEMRWVATNFQGRDAVHRVEFVIKPDCPAAGK